jgi:hypothetical protein
LILVDNNVAGGGNTGGGVYVYSSSAIPPLITNCQFLNNSALYLHKLLFLFLNPFAIHSFFDGFDTQGAGVYISMNTFASGTSPEVTTLADCTFDSSIQEMPYRQRSCHSCYTINVTVQ